MAQQYATDSGVLVIPGAYPKTVVQNNPSGLSTTGVLVLLGEADAGNDYSEETDLSLNTFGPDQVAEFTSKYRSGPLVDAFRGAAAAANDPNIPGSFSRCIAVKVNTAAKASGLLPKIGGGNYATIQDKSSGKSGNVISRSITQATAEIVPTTGAALICPPQVSTNIEFRVNGGAAAVASLTAAMLPPTIQSTISALTGVVASGGVNRAVINSVAGDITIAIVSGYSITATISGASFNALPTVGDLMYIPTGSPFAAANEGSYVVTAASGSVITAYKLRDAAGSGAALTPPTAEGPISIAATTDLACFSPIVISNEAGAASPGLGKSLEIADTSTGNLVDIAFAFTSATSSPPAAAATWASVSGTPALLTSAAEYEVTVNVSRQSDGISDSVTVGGDVVLTLGYAGTTASAVIAAGVMTITVAGGSGTSLTITLADYATVGDLADFISSQAGYTAAAADASRAQLSPAGLDAGTYTCASAWGAKTGRIKADGKAFLNEVTAGNSLVDIKVISPATALIGLPDVSSLAFLAGGSKGATTNAKISAALDALQGVRCNFVIPLFSRDATYDISDGLTDSASTYTIDSINSAVRSHVLSMSVLKRRRPRQAFVSYRGTFAASKTASGNMASSRVAMFFQDVKDVDSTGSLKQFQPWMAGVKAAGMQAAGFYRPIVNKFINISGALSGAGDFNDQIDSKLEDALLSGLCPIVRDEAGGYRWVSDQTTYTKDDNFVFNSIQAVYVGDVIAQTTAQRMERAFVGQSVADISAALALTTLEGIMSDMKRLKLISASDDAPKGFKSATIRIVGPAMVVSLEIKLAGAIYFIPISFLVTPVTQSAG